MNTATDTKKFTVGDKVVVTRWYNAEGPNESPTLATVVGERPDMEGDLLVRDIQRNVDRFAYRGCYVRVPQVGERVKAVRVPGMPEYEGRTATVADHGGRSWENLALQAGNIPPGLAPRLYVRFDEGGLVYVNEWAEVEDDEPVTVPVESSEVVALRAQVAALSADKAAYREGFRIIASESRDQAIHQDWCEEYERAVARIVSNLRAKNVPLDGIAVFEEAARRKQDYNLSEVTVGFEAVVEFDDGTGTTFTGSVTGTVCVSVNQTIAGRSDEDAAEEEAREWAEGYFDSSEISEALPRNMTVSGDYRYDWSTASFEIDEV